jgi:hypothetical protein
MRVSSNSMQASPHTRIKMGSKTLAYALVCKDTGEAVRMHATKTHKAVGVGDQSLLNSAMQGREWSLRRPGRFTPKKQPLVPTEYETGWSAEQVWVFRREKYLTLTRIRTSNSPAGSLVNTTWAELLESHLFMKTEALQTIETLAIPTRLQSLT